MIENLVDKLIQGFNPYDLFRTVYGNNGNSAKRGPEYGEAQVGGETKRYKRGVTLE